MTITYVYTASIVSAMCNDGWAKNPHSEKCFKILNVYGSWNATRQKCSEQGADLVQIKDRAENLFFASEDCTMKPYL